jgi:hypothetical protein
MEELLFEKHFTPQQIAALWGRSDEFIRKLFQDEPGVQKIDCPERMHKRGYATIRIPSIGDDSSRPQAAKQAAGTRPVSG